jgi:MFS family permease
MAIDNILLVVLVPLAGAVSDRAVSRGRGRLPLVLTAYVFASAGMALFPMSARFGIAGIIAAMVVIYVGINLQRSPVQALVADAVPSDYRSVAGGSVTFQMCLGAIVFLMLGRILGMEGAFLAAAAAVLTIGAAFAIWLREPHHSTTEAAEASYASLVNAAWSAVRGSMPGLRAIFIASLLMQLTFQTFTTWYALYGTDRFGIRPEEVTIGFIAWALGAVVGALPAGFVGRRIGRRNAMLAGFALMAVSLVALDRVTDVAYALPLIGLVSAAWTLPAANAYPLFIEPIPRGQRGIVAALFVMCMAAGAVGDPLNGALFDLFGGYRPMFLIMAGYTALAFCAVLLIRGGIGEAGTGPAGT